MNITRPTITIIPSPSGKVFSYLATNEEWLTEYLATARFNSERDARKNGKQFVHDFDKEARAIESKARVPYHIMSALVKHGLFRSRPKLSANFVH